MGEGASRSLMSRLDCARCCHSTTGPHQQEDGGEGCHEESPLDADDLALVTNGKQELQEILEVWNGLFTRHGLKLDLEKTEVLHTGH